MFVDRGLTSLQVDALLSNVRLHSMREGPYVNNLISAYQERINDLLRDLEATGMVSAVGCMINYRKSSASEIAEEINDMHFAGVIVAASETA